MTLQFLISPQYDPFLNLAVETYLTDHQEKDTITLYLWKNQRTVVIGLNQNPFSECKVDTLLNDGGHLMRRRTGGGAVYHDLGNLNFSFVADKSLYDVRRQQGVIQKALQHFGLEAEISGRNDLLCQGRKFSGNAFFNGTFNNLHHGTILIKTDGELMPRYLTVDTSKLQKHGVKSVSSRVVNLSELTDITSDSIIEPLLQAFQENYGMKAKVLDFDELSKLAEVQSTRERITSHDYLFAKWEHFTTTKKARFPWGGVEISLHIDESKSIIDDIRIASDCLDTDTITEAETLLKGHSTLQVPVFEDPILSDIVGLVFVSE